MCRFCKSHIVIARDHTSINSKVFVPCDSSVNVFYLVNGVLFRFRKVSVIWML